MEDRVNLPLRGDAETEGRSGDDLFYFKQTGLFHLELFGSIHVEVGCFKPHFISDFPRGKFRRYLFLHFLLSHLVGGLSIISSSGQVRESAFQIG